MRSIEMTGIDWGPRSIINHHALRIRMMVPQTSNGLTLWAESPEEARNFLARAQRQNFPYTFETIYVAKRSPKNRSNDYVDGEYFVTSNDGDVTVYENVIIAPQSIIDLVQWCTCDIMISNGAVPVVVVEDTTHIVRMNVYQRIPRVYKAALLGVPAIAIQGTRGLDFRLRGDCWGMHRHLRAYAGISRLYPETAALPFYYIPDEGADSELESERQAFQYIEALISGNLAAAATIRNQIIAGVNDIDLNGFRGHIAPDIPSIEVTPSEVIIHIGAKPEKKSWREKGSGQMDPYIGMIAAAKSIYCYNEAGEKTKDLVVKFTYIPPGFWWFENWQESTSLYKTLAFEIADRVEFLGTEGQN